MLQTLFSPFRRSQQKTLALGKAAIAEVAQATSFQRWQATWPSSLGFNSVVP